MSVSRVPGHTGICPTWHCRCARRDMSTLGNVNSALVAKWCSALKTQQVLHTWTVKGPVGTREHREMNRAGGCREWLRTGAGNSSGSALSWVSPCHTKVAQCWHSAANAAVPGTQERHYFHLPSYRAQQSKVCLKLWVFFILQHDHLKGQKHWYPRDVWCCSVCFTPHTQMKNHCMG